MRTREVGVVTVAVTVFWWLLGMTGLVGSLSAQTPIDTAADAAVMRAAATITPASVAQDMTALTTPERLSRPLLSPGLTETARYVAERLQQAGLRAPEALFPFWRDRTSWVQRYSAPGHRYVDLQSEGKVGVWLMTRLDDQEGRQVYDESGDRLVRDVLLPFARDAYFDSSVGPQTVARRYVNFLAAHSIRELGQPLVIVAGLQTVATAQRFVDSLAEAVVLYVPAATVDSAIQRQILKTLYQGTQGVLIASDAAPEEFSVALAAHRQPVAMIEDHLEEGGGHWPWAVWGEAGRIQAFLGALQLDLRSLRTASAPVLLTVPDGVARLQTDAAKMDSSTAITLPNVLGWIEGGDPKLKNEYLVLSAHMDSSPDSASRSDNGNTLGIATLLAVASTLSQPGVYLRRSIIVLATSSGTTDFGGARFFAQNWSKKDRELAGSVTLNQLDGGDTLRLDGLGEVALAISPLWLAKAHADVGVPVVSGSSVFQATSDHFAFVQAAVPALRLHADSAPASPAVMGAGGRASYAAQVARFAFYLMQALATTEARPRWTPAGRQGLVSLPTP